MTDRTARWAGAAVDIGNSKADIAVISADGLRIRWVRAGTLTPQRLGWDGCAAAVGDGIDSATGHPGTTVDAAYVAVAGVDFTEEEELLSAALVRTDRFGRVAVKNDSYALLASGGGLHDGVCVVAGAGMNCVGVRGDREVRFAALGEISGDWGGGRDVAFAGLAAACRAQDGRGPETALRQAVAELFHVGQPLDVTRLLHTGALPAANLLPITELVFEAARAGDGEAVAIIQRQAGEVAAFVRAAHRRLGIRLGDVPIILGGSLLRLGGTVIHDAVRRELGEDGLPLIIPEYPPIVGALAGVAQLLGLDETVETIARRIGRPNPV